MDPTLDDGEFLLVNSLVYSEVNLDDIAKFVPFWDPGQPDERHLFHGPQRGDIIILNPRQRDQRDLVKRIVGVPGDVFSIKNGTVYINGRPLIEPYIKEPWSGSLDPVQIPAHEFFVMGDNRNNSLDSRIFGLVEEDDIIGKAMASWWPTDKWGLAPNEAPTFGPAP
jgi:signal peptidase I